MATLAQLETALVKADAAGNTDDARAFAAEIRKMRAPGVPKQPDAIDQGARDFAKDMPLGQQIVAGVGKAIVDTGRGIRGLFTDNGDEVRESRRLDAPLMDTAGGIGGNVGGNLLMALAPGGSLKAAAGGANALRATGAANALSAAGQSLIAPTSLKGAATLGGAFGAVQPAVDLEERVTNAGIGGAAGAGGQAAFNGLARMVKPNVAPGVQSLIDEGITPTPGQILGGGFKRAEEGLTSVPIVGDAIKGAQTRAVADLNTAAFNRALAPVGEKLPKGLQGREAVGYVQDKLGAKYDALLPKLTTQADGEFLSEVSNLQNMMATGSIAPQEAARFESILQNQVLSKFQAGADGAPTITGQTMKDIERDLGQLASRFLRSMDPDQQMVGEALQEVQSSLRANVQRSNPQFAAELKQINEGYANFKRVQRAASSVAAEDGVFSAAQLQNAVKAGDRSKDKSQFSRGNALMQDLSDNAKALIGPKVPDSGTPFRTLTALGAGGAAGGLVGPGTAAAVLAGPLLYSRPGQNALAALLTKRPDLAVPVSNALRRVAPYGAVPAVSLSGE